MLVTRVFRLLTACALPVCALGLLAVLLPSGCASEVPAGVRERFAGVAKQLRAFPPDHVFMVNVPLEFKTIAPMGLKTGPAVGGSSGSTTPGADDYKSLLKADYATQILLSLIADPDPKIRTLAAGALVAKGDPRLQRLLGPLTNDQSPTFDALEIYPTANYVPPHYAPQTVASAVLRLVEMPSKQFYDQYWAMRGKRKYCADWFLWQFRHEEFAARAREGIQNLPSPDRELITLWIGTGHNYVQNIHIPGYSDAELFQGAKNLGRENVLAVLRNQPPTTDPDLWQTDGSDSGYNERNFEMGVFLLAQAKDLLDASDADTLLKLEVDETARKNSKFFAYRERWAAAAASLRPKAADAILDAAEKRWPAAAKLELARWDVEGQGSLSQILQWFYASATNQNSLALAIESTHPNESYESLVGAILASDGLLKINGEAMYRFAMLARSWKSNFDTQFVDWIYAHPSDRSLGWGARRHLVVQLSGVARKLVLDPRFSKADADLIYTAEQSLVGTLKLSKAQSTRLDQLIRQIDFGNAQNSPESTLQEMRGLLRKGIRPN